MGLTDLAARIESRYQRIIGERFHRRDVAMRNREPLFSFTFDDFPRTALSVGGEILHRHGLRGTYYSSFGLMGTVAPTGQIFIEDDLALLADQGHELACHTYSHPDTWRTAPDEFKRSVLDNAVALEKFLPGRKFQSFSYPISGPRRRTKRDVGALFASCRGGGQTINSGMADLNLLKSFFIEKSRDRKSHIQSKIQENCSKNGWLIFSTHDVCSDPTPYGVTPDLFEEVVRWCCASGGRIVTVAEGVSLIGGSAVK